jgi:hypothetical protein
VVSVQLTSSAFHTPSLRRVTTHFRESDMATKTRRKTTAGDFPDFGRYYARTSARVDALIGVLYAGADLAGEIDDAVPSPAMNTELFAIMNALRVFADAVGSYGYHRDRGEGRPVADRLEAFAAQLRSAEEVSRG